MRIGVLGLGSIGLRHMVNLENLGHEVARYDPAMMTSAREAVITWTDAIVVASPSKEHAKDLMDAIDKGKHVLVEKPFGYDCPSHLDGFVQGARLRTNTPQHKKGLIIATGFNLRFHSCVKKAKELLPKIGNVLAAGFTVNQKTTKPPYLMDGILRNWCSHEIDLVHYLLGPGNVVSATAALDGDGNDTIDAFIRMELPGVNRSVFIQADYYSEPEQRYFWIEGEKGSIYVNLVKREVFTKLEGEKPYLAFQGIDTYDENYIDEMKAFIKSIETNQHQEPLATGEDGVRVLYTVMAARERVGI